MATPPRSTGTWSTVALCHGQVLGRHRDFGVAEVDGVLLDVADADAATCRVVVDRDLGVRLVVRVENRLEEGSIELAPAPSSVSRLACVTDYPCGGPVLADGDGCAGARGTSRASAATAARLFITVPPGKSHQTLLSQEFY